MRDRFRIGIVGAGFGQHVHVPAFRTDPRCEVVAISATTAERAERVAGQLSIPRGYGNWRELVRSSEVDIVSIGVPPALQPEIAAEAAEEGKHLFCEKPVAVDGTSALALIDRVARAGVRHAVDFIFPEIEAFRAARQCIDSGEIGTAHHVTVTWHVETRAYRLREQSSWKIHPGRGGGVLNSFGSHVLHYLEWLFGPITSARARLSGRNESRLAAWLDLRNGCEATMSVACDAFRGTGHRIEIHGQDGRIVLANEGSDYASGFTLSVATRQGEDRVVEADDVEGRDGRVAATGRIAARLVDAIEALSPVTPNLYHGLRAAVLSDALRESAAQSRVIEIDEPFDA